MYVSTFNVQVRESKTMLNASLFVKVKCAQYSLFHFRKRKVSSIIGLMIPGRRQTYSILCKQKSIQNKTEFSIFIRKSTIRVINSSKENRVTSSHYAAFGPAPPPPIIFAHPSYNFCPPLLLFLPTLK